MEVKQNKMACDFHAPHLSNSGCTTFQGGLITYQWRTYQLRVIQQPERARACGFGKSGELTHCHEVRYLTFMQPLQIIDSLTLHLLSNFAPLKLFHAHLLDKM
jgi:hypothetical protein